jgi:hypothetical protein
MKPGIPVFKRKPSEDPAESAGETTPVSSGVRVQPDRGQAERKPAIVSERARQAMPGRSLTPAETNDVFRQMVVEFVREFCPQHITNRRLVRPAAI